MRTAGLWVQTHLCDLMSLCVPFISLTCCFVSLCRLWICLCLFWSFNLFLVILPPHHHHQWAPVLRKAVVLNPQNPKLLLMSSPREQESTEQQFCFYWFIIYKWRLPYWKTLESAGLGTAFFSLGHKKRMKDNNSHWHFTFHSSWGRRVKITQYLLKNNSGNGMSSFMSSEVKSGLLYINISDGSSFWGLKASQIHSMCSRMRPCSSLSCIWGADIILRKDSPAGSTEEALGGAAGWGSLCDYWWSGVPGAAKRGKPPVCATAASASGGLRCL